MKASYLNWVLASKEHRHCGGTFHGTEVVNLRE